MYLVPGISRGCYRLWVYDVRCCCVRCADWYLLSLVGAIVRGCTTCWVAVCDVLADSGTACHGVE